MRFGRHFSRTLPILFMLAALLGGITSCSHSSGTAAPPRMKSWWNFYELAMTQLESGDAQSAMNSLETALGIRKGARYGYPTDHWRVRTYGLHYTDHYFPNREYGILLLEQGKLDDAVRYLEKSLSDAPSGRARHYLNLARGQLAALQQPAAPRITLDYAQGEAWTNSRTFLLEGSAAGGGYIRHVTVNDDPVFLELAEAQTAFSQEVPLQQGHNRLSILATDLLGQQGEASLNVTADWTPPTFAVLSVTNTSAGRRVSLAAFDDGLLGSVLVNGQEYVPAGSRQRSISFDLVLPPGEGLVLVIRDLAGNILSDAVSDTTLVQHQPRFLPVAQAGPATSLPPAASPTDKLRPTVYLKSASLVGEVYDEEFLLEGYADDRGGLAGIYVNGENLLDQAAVGADRMLFSRRLYLDEGTNRFTILIQDRAGNQVQKEHTVIRKPSEFLDSEHRLAATLPPLASTRESEHQEKVHRTLEAELLREPVRFRMIGTPRQWADWMNELGLERQDLSDPSVAGKLKAAQPAELFFVGGLDFAGRGLTVFVRTINPDSGAFRFVEDIYTENPDNDLPLLLRGLALKLEQHFPLVESLVQKIGRGGAAEIGAGTQNGVQPESEFIVMAPSENNPARPGQVRKLGETAVRLVVDAPGSKTAKGSIEPAEAAVLVKEGDYVLSR